MATGVSAIDVAKGWISAFESGNLDYLREHSTEDMQVAGVIPQPLTFKEYSQFYPNLLRAFPDWKFNASNYKQVGDRVTCSTRVTCIHSGVLDFPPMNIHGFQPTGKRVRLPLEQITFLLHNGKISRVEVEKVEGGGIPGVLTQIGALQIQPEKSRSRSK